MKINKNLAWISALLLSFLLMGCNQDLPDKLYDPDADKGATPVLTSIIPDGKPLAGVGKLTVTGENFSPVPEENYLYFSGQRATILSASSTQLYVIAPDVVGDSIVVKAAVFRVELFSNELIYELIPAVIEYGKIENPGEETQQGYALAVDNAENVFVQTDLKKIQKIALNGTTTNFATTSYVAAKSMKFGPGGLLYASAPAGRVRKIVQYAADGTESLFATFPATPEDFDFDAAGDILAAVDMDIYRIKPDKSKAVIGSLPAVVKSVKFYNGVLYCLQKADGSGQQKVWTVSPQESSLDNLTEIFDSGTSDVLAGASLNAMVVTENGDLVFGTNHVDNGIFTVSASGEVASLYASLIAAEITSLSWGNSTILYALRDKDGTTKVLRVDMDTVKSATYEGRQ